MRSSDACFVGSDEGDLESATSLGDIFDIARRRIGRMRERLPQNSRIAMLIGSASDQEKVSGVLQALEEVGIPLFDLQCFQPHLDRVVKSWGGGHDSLLLPAFYNPLLAQHVNVVHVLPGYAFCTIARLVIVRASKQYGTEIKPIPSVLV